MTLRKALVLLLYILFLLVPIYWLLNMSFKRNTEILGGLTLWPQDFTLANYQVIFTDPSWYNGYLNSLYYVCLNTLISLLVALPGWSVGTALGIIAGNALPLRNIPVGSTVHCIEMKAGKGAQIARAAGAGVQLVAREGTYALLRLRSGEMRKVPAECRATIGEVGNVEHNLEKLGKAGAKRWRGVKPTVRGAAMNPVDHPHGGGEAKAGQGNPHPVTPWGVPTKGYKTRKNKRTQQFIVRDRRS